MRAFATLAAAAVLVAPIPAIAAEDEPETRFVCTADQVLGPFLGSIAPVTFSPEVAALFGVDPAECQTPVEDF